MNRDTRDNRVLLGRLVVGAALMFGFGFLLVPLYDKFCEVTGINLIARPDEVVNTQVDTSRLVKVQFDANIHGLPWSFRPLQGEIEVHPGALTTIAYEVSNTRSEAVTGQAVPSYGPQQAGLYFRKMECFCFDRQTLQAGEMRVMPVAFVLDPSLPADVTTITLSYTFFEVEGGRAQLSASGKGLGS